MILWDEKKTNYLWLMHVWWILDFNKYAKKGQTFHRARRKRSYRNVERTVETLVVVDRKLYLKHGRENITTYVLSIFNIVGIKRMHASIFSIVLFNLNFHGYESHTPWYILQQWCGLSNLVNVEYTYSVLDLCDYDKLYMEQG